MSGIDSIRPSVNQAQLATNQQEAAQRTQKTKAAHGARKAPPQNRPEAPNADPVDKVEISRQGMVRADRAAAPAADAQQAPKTQPALQAVNADAQPAKAQAQPTAQAAPQQQTQPTAQASAAPAAQSAQSSAAPASSSSGSASSSASSSGAGHVYSYELYTMTESELLDLVQSGSITRAEMNDEISRRASGL